MMQRDNFSKKVRCALAARAGHKCSLCGKSTSGPSPTANSFLDDGIAAHITAAAPGGPRFDENLSTDQRRGIENGIWLCTRHGREIDSNADAYPIKVLHGRKLRREELAKRELEQNGTLEDRSAVLIDLPHADSPFRLFEIISPQPYTFGTTSSVRGLLCLAERPARLLNLGSEVIIETWESHPNVAGILATLLSNNIDIWQPRSKVIEKLRYLCTKATNSNHWSQVGAVEPLAFALSGKGYLGVHHDVLERLISAPTWRDADATRVREYYGTIGNQIAAIYRHWNDQFREGLLKANDVARLIDLLLSNDAALQAGRGWGSLLELLQNHAIVLGDSGAADLAGKVIEYVEALRLPPKM